MYCGICEKEGGGHRRCRIWSPACPSRSEETRVVASEEAIANYESKYYSELFETTRHLEAPAEQECEHLLQELLQRDLLGTDFAGWAAASTAEAGLAERVPQAQGVRSERRSGRRHLAGGRAGEPEGSDDDCVVVQPEAPTQRFGSNPQFSGRMPPRPSLPSSTVTSTGGPIDSVSDDKSFPRPLNGRRSDDNKTAMTRQPRTAARRRRRRTNDGGRGDDASNAEEEAQGTTTSRRKATVPTSSRSAEVRVGPAHATCPTAPLETSPPPPPPP